MTLIRSIFLMLMCGVILPAYGSNYSFLNYSATYYLDDSDWKIIEKTIYSTLDTAKDNQQIAWKNSESGAFGYLVATSTPTVNRLHCRKLRIYTNAHRVTGESSYRFCKINGQWKIVS